MYYNITVSMFLITILLTVFMYYNITVSIFLITVLLAVSIILQYICYKYRIAISPLVSITWLFGGKSLIAYYLKKFRISFPVDHRCISAFGFFGGKKPMKENVS